MADAKLKIAVGATIVLLVPLVLSLAAERWQQSGGNAYAAPGLEPMGVEAAQSELSSLLPALLLVIYDAFAQTSEAEIYDTLAAAADGSALEVLYLERAGAMVGGGLTETDQTIHEMRLIEATSEQSGETLSVDAAWEVIGTVGHTEHLHIRGNTYRANLSIAPVAGAWKVVDFELTDVDRQTAGELIEVERSWWN